MLYWVEHLIDFTETRKDKCNSCRAILTQLQLFYYAKLQKFAFLRYYPGGGGVMEPLGFHGYCQVPTFKLIIEWNSTPPRTTELQNVSLVNSRHLSAQENRWCSMSSSPQSSRNLWAAWCRRKMEDKRETHMFSRMLATGELQGEEKTGEDAQHYL